MATTHSPTFNFLELPIFRIGKFSASILSNATSDLASKPTISALNSRLSPKLTITSSAPSTT